MKKSISFYSKKQGLTTNRHQEGQESSYQDLNPEVLTYIKNSVADNTTRARESDIKTFLNWGGHLPSTPEEAANFFADQAKTKAVATLERYQSSLNHWHGAKRLPSPCKSELVRAVLGGISRTHGRKQRRAKPLLIDNVKTIIDHNQGTRLADFRNRSIILLGFSGAFRRSELIALRYSDLEFVEEGVLVKLRKSKTNQQGKYEAKPIPYASRDSKYCPVRRLAEWLQTAEIEHGSVYRRIRRNQQLGDAALSGDGFYKLLRKLCKDAGLDTIDFSPHSLRAGFITSAYLAGKDHIKTKQISGHRHQETYESYIRDADRYRNNAADLF
jgi:integrase